MPNAGVHLESTTSFPQRGLAEEPNWYAIHARPRNEKWIAEQLEEKSVITFLPLLQQIHQWSDRRSKVAVPMFSCYVFVRIAQTAEQRLKVLQIPGVLGFVGSERQGTPIPDQQIKSLQTAIGKKVPCAVHPFISLGQRVRIRGGSLNGMEGILVRQGSEQSIVVSVELLQQSVSIQIQGYNIELV